MTAAEIGLEALESDPVRALSPKIDRVLFENASFASCLLEASARVECW
jgi:hypothetical protein